MDPFASSGMHSNLDVPKEQSNNGKEASSAHLDVVERLLPRLSNRMHSLPKVDEGEEEGEDEEEDDDPEVVRPLLPTSSSSNPIASLQLGGDEEGGDLSAGKCSDLMDGSNGVDENPLF